jgi:hypothetical protein
VTWSLSSPLPKLSNPGGTGLSAHFQSNFKTWRMTAEFAAMIIPHIIDQFLWNELITKKGVGPKGMPIGKLTKAYKQMAEDTAVELDKENLEELFYDGLCS